MAAVARSSRFLTESRFELVPASRLPRGVAVAAAVLAFVAVLAVARSGGLGAALSGADALAAENAALAEEVSKLRVELDIERATREALDQQVAELNGRVVELNGQVELYRAKGGAQRARTSGN